jgi:hypothetical protein
MTSPMHWSLLCLVVGFTAAACFLASGFRYNGELTGAVIRMVAGLACALLGIVAAIACEFLQWRS